MFPRATIVFCFTLAVSVLGGAQDIKQALQGHVAALKATLAENQAALRRYTWTEHTDILLKGEVKKSTDKLCRYGPDGTVQKTPIGAPPPQKELRGMKKRVVEKKVGELTDYMDRAEALVKEYVPPSPEKIEAAFQAGTVSLGQAGPGRVGLTFGSYLKPGDSLIFDFNENPKAISSIAVNSYLDDQKDAVKLNVGFETLPDGTNHVASTVLDAPAKQVQVRITNSNYQVSQ